MKLILTLITTLSLIMVSEPTKTEKVAERAGKRVLVDNMARLDSLHVEWREKKYKVNSI